jgi:hypothetical protein
MGGSSSSSVLAGRAGWPQAQASALCSEPPPTLQLTPAARGPLLFSTASASSIGASTGGRQRLDVAERFNSLLSGLQCRLDSLGAATAGWGDDAAGLRTPPTAARSAAEDSLPDTLDGGAAAAAATPDSVAWLPGMGASHSGGGVLHATPLPFGSPGTPAPLLQAAAVVASTQTDPPAVPTALYMRAKLAGTGGSSSLMRFIPRLLRLVVAYLAALLLFPLNRLVFNRLSAAVTVGGERPACLPA